MTETLSREIGLEATLVDIVKSAYDRGLRSNNLDSQPAPWLVRGLQILEKGEDLTSDKIDRINRSGGTDHPDPWF